MREFDFDSVGKRMPYSAPEGFIPKAKSRATMALSEIGAPRHSVWSVVGRVAVAASVAVAVCGVAIWIERYSSPERQYDRLLAKLSSDVLWEYECECEADEGYAHFEDVM